MKASEARDIANKEHEKHIEGQYELLMSMIIVRARERFTWIATGETLAKDTISKLKDEGYEIERHDNYTLIFW